MGGRKQRRPVRTRPLPSIPKIFDCPRCEATAIRISMEKDLAIIECGRCHLKQTVTEIKSIEEPIDIYGNFLDTYYLQLEASDTEPLPIDSVIEEEEQPSIEETSLPEETPIEEETSVEQDDLDSLEEEVKTEPQVGFVPRAKNDVLKKKFKLKPKEKKNKK